MRAHFLFILYTLEILQNEQKMSPHVPNLQLKQLLIFCHLCFICFSTPHIHTSLQLFSFILLGNFYTLKYTIFHCAIVANEYSHIINVPITI